MGDLYRFRSGAPVDAKALRRMMGLCTAARDGAVMAQSFDGHDDLRRDDFLDTAAASLAAAQQALADARTPPVPPAVVARADAALVDAIFDIARGPHLDRIA